MFDLLLRRARLTDDTLADIAIQDGKIAALGEINAPAHKTVELNGEVLCLARAGLILTFTATPNPRFIMMSRTASASRLASRPSWMRAVPVPTMWTIFTEITRKASTAVYRAAEYFPHRADRRKTNWRTWPISMRMAVQQAVKRLPGFYRWPESPHEQQRGR